MTRLHALCGGRLAFDRSLFFPQEAAGVTMTVPVPAWLVIHPRGTLLFDTGVDCPPGADPASRFGARIAGSFRSVGAADEQVIAQLARLGLSPDQVSHVANSHLHFDHCGCNAMFPRARFLVQRAELEAVRQPVNHGFAPGWDHALDYQAIDGEHDVFGDGDVLLLPTPGHTPGHQALKVRVSADQWYVMTADACYTESHLATDTLPGAVWHPQRMRESMAMLRRLDARSDTRLLFGHDAAQWARLPAAGRAIT